MDNIRINSSIISTNQKIVNYLFVLIVFVVTRQFPFSFLSPVMNLAVIVMIYFSLIAYKQNIYTYYIIFLFLLFPLSYSLLYSFIFTNNKIALILKFYITLLSVGLAYFVHVDKPALKSFIILCIVQVFIMAAIFLYIIVFLDINTYLPLRAFFREKGWGDVYTYNGFYYRIQLKGNALLVIAFILNFEIQLFKRQHFVAALLLFGIILAGNFAYTVSLAVYLIYKLFNTESIKSINIYFLKLMLFAVLLILISPVVYDYVVSTLDMKSEDSLATRNDQFGLLIKNLAENNFTLLLGQGLGNTLAIQSSYRDYTDNTYYELQLIYILNQLGIIFFSSFLLYNIFIVLRKWGKGNFKIYFAYFVYLSYAITNPYIIDTNQIIVIIVLNSWLVIDKLNYCNSNVTFRHILQT